MIFPATNEPSTKFKIMKTELRLFPFLAACALAPIFVACSTPPPDYDYDGDDLLAAIARKDNEALDDELSSFWCNPNGKPRGMKHSYLYLALRLDNLYAAKALAGAGAELSPREAEKFLERGEPADFLLPLFPERMENRGRPGF